MTDKKGFNNERRKRNEGYGWGVDTFFILGREVVKIEYPDCEKTIDVRYDAKAIRLDVYIMGEKEVYNIEMQNVSYRYLPKRGRKYQ